MENPRLQQGISWITTYQRFDDRIKETLKGWPHYRFKNRMPWKTHLSYGAIKTLKAFAEIPEKQQSTSFNWIIKNGTKYFLIHHVFKSSHNLNRIPKPGWLKFGFPLIHQTDALEILGILTKFGYNDE